MSSTTHTPVMPPQSSRSKTPHGLVAFPSLSRSLCTLPAATSLDALALHPAPFAQRASESEDKLEVALARNKERQQGEAERLQQQQQWMTLQQLQAHGKQQPNMYPSQPESPLTIKTRKSKAT